MNLDGASGDSSGKSLKSNLRGWKEIAVVTSKLVKWEKPVYPAIVVGLITLIFLFIWYVDPSVITGISMMLMLLCICDFLVPFVAPMIFHEGNWNSTKEKEYSDVCNALNDVHSSLRRGFGGLFQLKDTNPLLYVAVATVSLSTLAWLGNQMHNLMLLYFAVLVITSIPALMHHGILQRGMVAVGKLGKKRKD